MEVRSCSPGDLALLRMQWPTNSDVAGAHFDEQQSGVATFLVAWEVGEPLGWALIQWGGCIGENARAAFPQCIEVNHLQVGAQSRGRGVGTAILVMAEQCVSERGPSQVAVSAGLANNNATRLYRRLGYEPTSIVDTCSYRWCDDEGGWHQEVESSELLIKQLAGRLTPLHARGRW
jgi:GNAT superfamily N-acetyltransferase